MNTLIRKGDAGNIRIPHRENLPLSTVSASAFRPSGAALFTALDVTPTPFTLAAPAAKGGRLLSLATSPAVSRGSEYYLLGDAAAEGTQVESVVVTTADGPAWTLERPLIFAWPTSAKVWPHWIDVPIPIAHTMTCGRNFRVEVVATVYGRAAGRDTLHKVVTFDVVTNIPTCLLTVAELRRRLPSTFSELAGTLGKDDAGFDASIGTAFGLVLEDVSRIIPPDFVMSSSVFVEPTVAKIKSQMAEDGRYLQGDADRRAVIRETREEYQHVLDQALASAGWVDRSQSGIVDRAEPSPLAQRVYMDPF